MQQLSVVRFDVTTRFQKIEQDSPAVGNSVSQAFTASWFCNRVLAPLSSLAALACTPCTRVVYVPLKEAVYTHQRHHTSSSWLRKPVWQLVRPIQCVSQYSLQQRARENPCCFGDHGSGPSDTTYPASSQGLAA